MYPAPPRNNHVRIGIIVSQYRLAAVVRSKSIFVRYIPISVHVIDIRAIYLLQLAVIDTPQVSSPPPPHTSSMSADSRRRAAVRSSHTIPLVARGLVRISTRSRCIVSTQRTRSHPPVRAVVRSAPSSTLIHRLWTLCLPPAAPAHPTRTKSYVTWI